MDRYDLVVVGSGAGGSGVATGCAKAGWRVAVIDDEPYGGTCALRGCDPKKVLVGVSELIDWHRRMTGRGVSGDTRLDWPALMEFKRTFTEPVPSRQEAAYKKLGIGTYQRDWPFRRSRPIRCRRQRAGIELPRVRVPRW